MVRKVDVSRQAARRLGMIHDGTAQVAVKVVDVPGRRYEV
jgi:rare lipoprotein A (peptidoglycan hydrolase)